MKEDTRCWLLVAYYCLLLEIQSVIWECSILERKSYFKDMIPIIEKAEIIEKIPLTSKLLIFRLKVPEIARRAEPGQFVEIDPGARFFLRRPFSIQDVNDNGIELLIKVVGEGTASLVELKSPWEIIGPLGRGFHFNTEDKIILVGGGIGVAPLKFLYSRLKQNGLSADFYVGARTSIEIPIYRQDPIYKELKISTDDGSKGFKGTVVEHVVKTINIKDSPRIFACGPKMMLKVLRKFMLKKELQGEFSLENRMGCGMGVCQGCAIPVRNGYKLVCKDGPVFDFAEIGDEYWQNV